MNLNSPRPLSNKHKGEVIGMLCLQSRMECMGSAISDFFLNVEFEYCRKRFDTNYNKFLELHSICS